MSESRDTLKKEFLDPEYRYAYAEDFLNTLIATQIRVLRDQRRLTQEEVSVLIGTKQAGVSRLENVNYSSWKTETLRKIARALKVRLKITFEDFTTLLDDAENFSRESLERVSFEEDPTFQTIEFKSHPYHRKTRPRRASNVWNRLKYTSAQLGGISNMQLQFNFDRAVSPKVIEIRILGATKASAAVTLSAAVIAGAGGYYGIQTINPKEHRA